ncbi:MAG: hypothetical protein VSS52_009300 [Thiotrichaceae bacterium]|nr:hypothetical protein [Thiotrichaceae bacterium]
MNGNDFFCKFDNGNAVIGRTSVALLCFFAKTNYSFCFNSKNIFCTDSARFSVAINAAFSYNAFSRAERPTRVDKPSLVATPSAVP